MNARSLCTLGLLAALNFGCSSDSEPPASRPNIVLVTIDTLRADRVGAMGSTLELTPNMDAFAARSVAFQGAVTPIGTTAPAHSSLFTGLYPSKHGVRWNGDQLAVGQKTLAKLLKESGYDTGAFVSMPLLIDHVRLGRGFTARSDHNDAKVEIRPGVEVNRLAKEWLSTTRDAPFFLWVHYFEVHSPYRMTEHAQLELGDYEGPFADGASVEAFHSLGSDGPSGRPFSAENLATLNTLYDGEVVEADLLVAELLQALGQTQGEAQIDSAQAKNTVVILAADHGQMLGEHSDHGKLGHGFRVWEEVIRVPLIIHDPSATNAGTVQTRVGLIDLYPTILDYADVAAPDGTQGRSLRAAVGGKPLQEELYLAETRSGDKLPQSIAASKGAKKVILSEGVVSAFNLASDPGESQPLEVQGDPEFERLAKIARAYLAARRDRSADGKLSESTTETLRNLGYVE